MRLNIEEKWKTDPRRNALGKKLGSLRAADGMLIEIGWLVLTHKGQPIPLTEFKFIDDWQHWIDCGLAAVEDALVHVRGAEAYQEFFDKQCKNGKKGGRPPKPKITQNNPNEPNETQAKPKKPSSSSSFSFSEEEEYIYTQPPASEGESLRGAVNEAWGIYNESIQSLGIPRKAMGPSDEALLAGKIRELGAERVKNALEGLRQEKPNGTFNPKNCASLSYCLQVNRTTGRSNHDRLENLALAARASKATKLSAADLKRIATGRSDD